MSAKSASLAWTSSLSSILIYPTASSVRPLTYLVSISNITGLKQILVCLNTLLPSLLHFSRYHPHISVVQAKFLGIILNFFLVLTFHNPIGSVFTPKLFLVQPLCTISPAGPQLKPPSLFPASMTLASWLLSQSPLAPPLVHAPLSSWVILV